jgi:hypothetical protein
MLKYFIISYVISFVIGMCIFYPLFKYFKRKKEEKEFVRFLVAQQEMQKTWNNVYPNNFGGYMYRSNENKDKNHNLDEES